MLEESFSRAVKAFSQEEEERNNQSHRTNKKNADDDNSRHPQSVNLLRNKDDVDDDNHSHDSDETELPSQNLQFGTRQMNTNNKLPKPKPQPQIVKNGNRTQAAWISTRPKNASGFLSPCCFSGLHGTPPSNPARTAAAAAAAAAGVQQSDPQRPSPSLQELKSGSLVSPRVLPIRSPTTEEMRELSHDMDALKYPGKSDKVVESPETNHKQPKKSSTAVKKRIMAKASKDQLSNMPPPPSQPKRLVTTQTKATPRMSGENANANQSNQEESITTVQFELPPNFAKEWVLVSLQFPEDERASLGLAIARGIFPGLEPQPSKQHCLVSRIIQRPPPEDDDDDSDDEESMSTSKTPRLEFCGPKFGIQAGDWFLVPGKDYSKLLAPPTLASFEQIQQWSKQKPYQTICVLRRRPKEDKEKQPKVTPGAAGTTTNAGGPKKRKAPPQSTTAPAPAKKPMEMIPTPGPTELKGLVVPFCNRCNAEKNNKKQKPRLHHAWCPQNHCFDNSGADDIMIRIVQGRRLDCPACEKEFQSGKPLSKLLETGDNQNVAHHSDACLKNQQRLDKEQEERERREMEETEEKERRLRQARQKKAKPSKPHQARSNVAGAKKRQNQQAKGAIKAKESSAKVVGQKGRIVEMDTDSSSSGSDEEGDDDDMEDVSVYLPSQKRGKLQTLRIQKTNTRSKPKSKPMKVTNENKESEEEQAEETQHVQRTQNGPKNDSFGHLGPPATYKPSDFDDQDWIALEGDPWGPEGHTIDDVVLYGPARGQGHFETFVPSSRYRIDPFEAGSEYRNSHRLPEEGFSLITLKRDTLGRIPWGFQVERDEFGHACLVTSVELSSPASAATYLGASTTNNSSKSVLNVHDMIVMINGKPVGGMSEVGFSLELELSAPNLYVAVSPYKLAERVRKKIVNLEREALSAVDSASRDRRLVGWQEVGNGVQNEMIATDPDQANGQAEAISASEGKGNDKSAESLSDEENEAPEGKRNDEPAESLPEEENEDSDNKKRSNTDQPKPILEHSGQECHPATERTSDDRRGIQKEQEGEKKSDNESLVPEEERDGIVSFRKQNNIEKDESDKDTEKDPDDDSNPWLGCVCGEIHSTQSRRKTRMFWIQCESCNAWYDVSETCIGFTEKDAKERTWKCEACEPCESDDEEETTSRPMEEEVEEASIEKKSEDKSDQMIESSQTENDQSVLKGDGADRVSSDSSSKELFNVAQSLIQMGIQDLENVEGKDGLKNAACDDKPKLSYEAYRKAERKSRRTADGCLKPKRDPIQQSDGTYAKPSGHPPRDKYWDKHRGLWVPLKKDAKSKQPVILSQSMVATKPSTIPVVQARNKETSQNLQPERFSKRQDRKGKDLDSISDTEATPHSHVFSIGDLVMMEQHSWPGVNHEGGVGKIVDIKIDDEGKKVYDVKYMCGRATAKNVREKYITPHSFD